jgi:hypothetical protein
MLSMGLPVLRVLGGQGWVMDNQQIFRILLLGRLGKVTDRFWPHADDMF